MPGGLVPLLLALLLAAPAAGSVGTRANPYRLGSLVREGGFAARVLAVDTNAWRSLRRANPAARRPAPGFSDVLVTIRVTNRTKTAGIPFVDGALDAVGPSRERYTSLTDSCGTIPGDVSSISPVPAGKTVTVHACWQVWTLDVRSLVMYFAPYGSGRTTYFALHRSAGRG